VAPLRFFDRSGALLSPRTAAQRLSAERVRAALAAAVE
jgi:hypothetical protein